MMTKIFATGAVVLTNAFVATDAFAQASGSNATVPGAGCIGNKISQGSAFYAAIQNFIGSPVFYFVMFLLALGGLYAAIVKQETSGWYAVIFAAIGAAMPNIFATIINFGCNVAQPFTNAN